MQIKFIVTRKKMWWLFIPGVFGIYNGFQPSSVSNLYFEDNVQSCEGYYKECNSQVSKNCNGYGDIQNPTYENNWKFSQCFSTTDDIGKICGNSETPCKANEDLECLGIGVTECSSVSSCYDFYKFAEPEYITEYCGKALIGCRSISQKCKPKSCQGNEVVNCDKINDILTCQKSYQIINSQKSSWHWAQCLWNYGQGRCDTDYKYPCWLVGKTCNGTLSIHGCNDIGDENNCEKYYETSNKVNYYCVKGDGRCKKGSQTCIP